MKLLDKLKNALFEEEYVEVEEKPAKLKKEKPKRDINQIKEEKKIKDVKFTNYEDVDEELERPIAKKIANDAVVPDKISKSVEDTYERALPKKEEFKFPTVDDEDFVTPSIKVTEIVEEKPLYKENLYKEELYKEKKIEENKVHLYKTSKEDEYIKSYTSHEYGNYEKTNEKKVFKPSPNISPIYGIIDNDNRNFREEPKKEVRLTSALRSEKLDVDDVRRKAFGTIEDDLKSNIGIMEEEKPEEVSESMFVDLRDNNAPEVNKVTMGDAEEYFQDLGLEYDNDYIDARKAKASGRRLKSEDEYDSPKVVSNSVEEDELPSFLKEKKEVAVDDTITATDSGDEDNLFDLIDSMYDK